MVKADLITGFLGSGKTTFIIKYAKYLKSMGERIAILENDLGAVNVDALLLEDIEDDACDVETVAGGCDHDCHVRRFRTKLIAMGMQGFDRVIVEPSGIYDVDEFFDVLHEEPLDRWYEIGNVIAILDIHMLENSLSREARYFIMSQASQAGLLVLSHVQEMEDPERKDPTAFINGIMKEFGCDRRYEREDVLDKDWRELTKKDFDRICSGGRCLSDHIKLPLEDEHGFSSLYFMNMFVSVAEMEKKAALMFQDRSLGEILRIKGFHFEDGKWYELNASRSGTTVKECKSGQEVWIVIGEDLDQEAIQRRMNARHSL
jgi:G3E family GTPase